MTQGSVNWISQLFSPSRLVQPPPVSDLPSLTAQVSDGRLLRVLQIIPGWPRAGDAKGPQPGSKSSSSSSGSG